MSVSASIHIRPDDPIEAQATVVSGWISINYGQAVLYYDDDADVTRTIAALMELRDAMRERAGLPDEAVPELVQ